MQKSIDVISAAPIFNGLPEDQILEIEKISVKKQLQRGEVIFSEGDDGNGFYIVAHGRVKIFKVSLEGKEQILHIFGPGEPFGEVPVFTGKPFPANAQAIANSVVLFFPKDAFVHLIATIPSLALNMIAVLSMRLRQFTHQIENLSLKEVPARLASYLLYLVGGEDGSREVSLKISKGQLASLLGTIPETLSRIFAKMSAQGLIVVNGRDIQIDDLQCLQDLAAGSIRLE